MRKKAEQQRIVRQCAVHFHTMVRITGGNQETIIGQLQRDYAFCWRLLCEHQPDTGPVFCRMSVCCVMHLKHNVGSGGQQFREVVGPLVGGASGRVDQQNIARGPHCIPALSFRREIVGAEGNADRSPAQP